MESKRQKRIIDKMTAQGWLCVKLIKTNLNGIPDLMCLKDGKVVFIEVKQPTGILSEIQKYRIKQIEQLGFNVEIWVDFEENFKKVLPKSK